MKGRLIGQIVSELRAADADMDRIIEAAASSLQLHRTDFRCLDILSRAEPLTAGQLGAAMGLTSGALTALLDRLEARRYVRRRRDTQDRRRVMIEVTRSARRLVEPIFKPLVTASIDRFSEFTVDDLGVVLRFVACNRQLIEQNLARVSRVQIASATPMRGFISGEPQPPTPLRAT
jgi:DNA-binding MarR family transcriptional regulator